MGRLLVKSRRWFYFYLSGVRKTVELDDTPEEVEREALLLRAETGGWGLPLLVWKHRDGAWRKLQSPPDNWGRGLIPI